MFRILYCSQNMLEAGNMETKQEIAQILARSRANNGQHDVTGALLFNSGYFAQVLEGPQPAIEETFERIQRDHRHGSVTILECSTVEQRDFPDWSMAHVEPASEKQAADASHTLTEALADPGTAGHRVIELLRSLVVQDE